MIVTLVALLVGATLTAGLAKSFSKDDPRHKSKQSWDKTTVLRHYPSGRIEEEEY